MNDGKKQNNGDGNSAVYTMGIACIIAGLFRLLIGYHRIRSVLYIIIGIGIIGWAYDETLWIRLLEKIEAKGNDWLDERERRKKGEM